MKQKLFSRSDIESQFGSLSAAEGKKKLADYALKNYDIKLARNKSFENMMNDFESEVNAKFEAARAEAGDAKETIDMGERVDLSKGIELDPDKMDIDDETPETTEQPVVAEPSVEIVDQDQVEEKPAIPFSELKIEAPTATEITTQVEEKPVSDFVLSFPEDYAPKYRLVGPEGRAFINVPYWIHDWMQGRNWKIEIAECPYDKELLKSLAFYIERDGSVAIRESRNSKFIVIS